MLSDGNPDSTLLVYVGKRIFPLYFGQLTGLQTAGLNRLCTRPSGRRKAVTRSPSGP